MPLWFTFINTHTCSVPQKGKERKAEVQGNTRVHTLLSVYVVTCEVPSVLNVGLKAVNSGSDNVKPICVLYVFES